MHGTFGTTDASCATWHLVRSERHRERQAAEAIAQLGVTVYLPFETRWSRNGRRLTRIKVPLFPQYLFAAFDVQRDPWGKISRSWWVHSLSCNGDGVPIKIPGRQVEAVREAEAAEFYDLTKPLKRHDDCPFSAGDKVRLLSGPFSGLLAEVRSATSMRRVEILFELLGKATVPACNLARV